METVLVNVRDIT